jgi:hypothetical protein
VLQREGAGPRLRGRKETRMYETTVTQYPPTALDRCAFLDITTVCEHPAITVLVFEHNNGAIVIRLPLCLYHTSKLIGLLADDIACRCIADPISV